MFRSILLVCAILLIVTVALFKYRADESPADLRYVNPSGIHTLDPARLSWTQDFRVALNIWEGLTTWDPATMGIIAAAADLPPHVSPDGLEYTFSIRNDTRWSNGDAVTAADFIRGWRRGLEPGTATDYTFLFTDHIDGAKEYVEWRRQNVAVLTALKRLADGWNINEQQADSLVRHPIYESIRPAIGLPAVADLDKDETVVLLLADRINEASLDWTALYGQVFEEHQSALDEHFQRVDIEAIDASTLRVRLIAPCPYILDLLAMPIFLPCHESIEKLRYGGKNGPLTPEGLVVYDPQWTKPDYHTNGYPGLITNGPYRLADWTFKRRARLTVNPYYRDAASISCRTVDMLVYESISASIMAYEAGDVDFLPAMDVPYDHEIARLARSGRRRDFHLCKASATYFLNFNCLSTRVAGRHNPFRDPRVRTAFALATDKQRIVENVLGRGDRVAHSFVPPHAMPGYQTPDGLTYDVGRARQLLADAGYPDGQTLPVIDLLYVPADERVCQALAKMWEDALGVRVELHAKESKTFAEDKANHRFMIARGNWYADYNDPTTFLDCLTIGNGNNDSGYANPAYDALLSEASRARDAQARMELLRRAEAILVEQDLPILPILHYVVPIAIKPHVKGLYPNPRLWFPFRYVEVTR